MVVMFQSMEFLLFPFLFLFETQSHYEIRI